MFLKIEKNIFTKLNMLYLLIEPLKHKNNLVLYQNQELFAQI